MPFSTSRCRPKNGAPQRKSTQLTSHAVKPLLFITSTTHRDARRIFSLVPPAASLKIWRSNRADGSMRGLCVKNTRKIMKTKGEPRSAIRLQDKAADARPMKIQFSRFYSTGKQRSKARITKRNSADDDTIDLPGAGNPSY